MPVRRKRPYKKKYAGKRSRPQKRARTDGRMRRAGSKSYSSIMNIKCEATQVNQYRYPWEAGDDLTAARQKVYWDNLSAISTDVISLRNSPEFVYWAPKFINYEVKGIRIEYRPYKFDGGGYSSASNSVICSRDSWQASWTDYEEITDPGATRIWNYANAFCQADFKAYTHGKSVKKYINLTKYYKKRGMTRKHIYVSNPQPDNLRPNATYFMSNMNGLNNGFDIGRFTVTYYVQFSGFIAL